MNYIKSLDSLRAVAVLGVIASHRLAEFKPIEQLGSVGVNTFFVLSGFLITRILLENRELDLPKGELVMNFYIRRTLRISPIYYITLLILLLLGYSTSTDIQHAYPYYLTYTANFYFYNQQRWDSLLAHIWSLSVEEQFYLIWPWLMLYVKPQYIQPVIIAFIGIGISSWYLMPQNEFTDVLTPTTFHTFGLGALLAWMIVYKPGLLPRFYKLIKAIALMCLLLIMLPMVHVYPFRTLWAPVALWVITYLVLNADRSTRLDFIVLNPILLFLGRISYGLYLYHLLAARLAHSQFSRLLLDHLTQGGPKWVVQVSILAEQSILLLLVAWLSYRFIEQPFLRLKPRMKTTNGR